MEKNQQLVVQLLLRTMTEKAATVAKRAAANCVSSFAKRDSTSSSFCSSPLVARSGFGVLEEPIDAPEKLIQRVSPGSEPFKDL